MGKHLIVVAHGIKISIGCVYYGYKALVQVWFISKYETWISPKFSLQSLIRSSSNREWSYVDLQLQVEPKSVCGQYKVVSQYQWDI